MHFLLVPTCGTEWTIGPLLNPRCSRALVVVVVVLMDSLFAGDDSSGIFDDSYKPGLVYLIA